MKSIKAQLGFSLGAAAALLAGCGGSQPPIAAPGAIPQSAIAPARTVVNNIGIARSPYRVLYSFRSGDDGARPEVSLLDVKGTLYGTTFYGGTYGYGTVFSISTAGTEHVLYSFRSGDDGANPNGSLIEVNGKLYGTTYYGGSYGSRAGGDGTVFSIRSNGTEHVLHSFGSGSDGVTPSAGLLDVNGTLYGTTGVGGKYNWGTVFSISTTGAEHVLYNFTGFSGGLPGASLIDVNGTLYGTTGFGGKYGEASGGDGTVFSVSTSGMEQVLHNFGKGSDGKEPAASLVDVKGELYSTTLEGGEYGSGGAGGTVFGISTTGREHVLHNFGAGSDGKYPNAALLDVKGSLYGATWQGGRYGGSTYNSGTIFSISTTGENYRVLHSFGKTGDGAAPKASLINAKGTLYGTTYAGGTHRYGTAFTLRLTE